jgi:cytochrome c oxidase assembly protein subunit 15
MLLSNPQTEKRKPGFKLAYFGVLFAFVVIGLGAFTRLVDAGLGCPDWPTCYGHILWPQTELEISQANQAFPDMPVIDGKAWPEMVHRYFATGLGVIAILLVISAIRNRQQQTPLKLPLFLLAFIILQGLFGMWTVTLKLWPQVVTAHLLGGFTTLSLLWLLTLRLGNSIWRLPLETWQKVTALRGWAMLGLLVVIVQVFLGGWTTSNYAAVACPDLPTCQGQWWPAPNFVEGFNFMQKLGPNYLGGAMDNESRVAIHLAHRIGAVITTAILLLLCWRMRKQVPTPQIHSLSQWTFCVLLLQVALGLSNIIFHFPLFVAVAHNLGGALLLLTIVTLNYRIITAKLL